MSSENSHRRASKPAFELALHDAGGVGAPREQVAGLRAALLDELLAGAAQLDLTRSGYGRPVAVAFAVVASRAASSPGAADEPGSRGQGTGSLISVAPVDQAFRADPGAIGERSWLLTAAVVGAMTQAAAVSNPVAPSAVERSSSSPAQRAFDLRAGALGDWLVLALPVAAADSNDAAELAALAFEDEAAGIDRLRARAYAVPPGVLGGFTDLRAPIGDDHPLRAAEAVARLGGRPADETSVADHEEEVLVLLGASTDTARPHEEQDPALRAARRILQRLAGMGKWGGYHTDVAHLARGFAGNERALAMDIGERLISAGLLVAKPSVGQRHVFLNPRRAGDIHALIERGVVPAGLVLPGGRTWTRTCKSSPSA
ncbi:MAG: hypothetical protein M3065_03955 [Actinomycetota bacterium]|nr:hypothetical protein [Actinomycetota bacterium]